ncbi:MAG: HTTM domain-containing protein [Pirellula sp.]
MILVNAWNKFWFSRADVLPQSVTRIAVGMIWLAFLTVTAPNWERFYGSNGVLSIHDSRFPALQTTNCFGLIDATDGWIATSYWWWIGLVCALCVTLGFKTRVATIGLFLFSTSIIQRNAFVVNGEELVTRMLLFYGCFSHWGTQLSFDRWIYCRKNPNVEHVPPMVWNWRLMQINFIMIYVISVPYKIVDDMDWLTGDALHWTVASDMWWTRGWMSELTLSFYGIPRKLLTWGTIFVEAAFPCLVCFRRTRLTITLAVIFLHLGIAYCIPGVTLFTLSMVAGAAMFISTESYQAIARTCLRWIDKYLSWKPIRTAGELIGSGR